MQGGAGRYQAQRDVAGAAPQIDDSRGACLPGDGEEPVDESLIDVGEIGTGVRSCLGGIVHELWFEDALHPPITAHKPASRQSFSRRQVPNRTRNMRGDDLIIVVAHGGAER